MAHACQDRLGIEVLERRRLSGGASVAEDTHGIATASISTGQRGIVAPGWGREATMSGERLTRPLAR